MADSFVINAPSAGASAAGTILTEDVSFNAELTNVSLSSTAAASANVTVDIRKNGTSVFTGLTIGTVQTGATAQGPSAAVSASQGYVDILPNQGASIEDGTVLLIDTEQMRVQAPAAGTPGYPSGATSGITGSPFQSPSGVGVVRAWVVRGVNGTTAASHAGNANVFQALPTLLTGSATTGSIDVNSGPNTRFSEGDTLTVVVGGAGATNLTASLAFERV